MLTKKDVGGWLLFWVVVWFFFDIKSCEISICGTDLRPEPHS